MKTFAAILAALIACALAEQKCQPNSHGVRVYQGKKCASTTRYNDGHRGSCGCGPAASDTPFDWNMSKHVTAPNQMYYDNGGNSQWCGKNCGKCVKLTPTGGFVPGNGKAPQHRNPVVFMVTNSCPINENRVWCGQSGKPGTNKVNDHGYEAHFDLQNNKNQVLQGLGWDNAEVTWQEVSCPHDYASLWSKCECHGHH
uniref:Cellulase n=1 Tax=Aplysia kurodai TaxID=6501 RepID=A0A077JGH0_APLKU|nr:cellulase [Aplysia kurodai]